MHQLAAALIPFDAHRSIRPLVARDAAALARLETLMYRYEQPPEQMWGVDVTRGFIYDWWALGGRWPGWGRDVRTQMTKHHLRPSRRPIPRFLERKAVWSEDLARVRMNASICPDAILTPHGEWMQCAVFLPPIGMPTIRERKARSAWLKKIRNVMHYYPGCLAIAVDFHN